MKQFVYLWAMFFILTNVLSTKETFCQNSFLIRLEGLNPGDSATIIIQKSSEQVWKQKAFGNDSMVNELTFDLENGQWVIVIDAKGYTFPPATAFDVPEKSSAMVKLTPLLNEDFYYVWQDDDSYVGHATQTYVSEPEKIVVLDKEVRVPNDYSSIELRNKYGIILSDEKEKWTIEDSYRIYKMFCNLPYGTFGEGSVVNPATGENIRGIFELTKEQQFRDLTITTENGIKKGIISQAAFNYASPQIVTIDGIKGKFFSKRLYHAVVNFVTDFANDEATIDWIAQERFGVRFMKPNQETEDLMNEDSSNFQEFFKEEKIEILSMFEELPEGFHKQAGLKYLVRRINGQSNPKYPNAAAIAWTGLYTIEFMDIAFSGSDLGATRRLILHEKAHFLWAYTFDEKLKNDWIEVGGWFLDPTSGSGWSTYNTTEFVSAYGHGNNPDEDMAETVATYLENPDKLKAVSVRKYEFIRDRVMHGTRYIAQIREDLTFMVYNLFPDYTYPGKVKKIEVHVIGKPEEDKQVTIRITLHSKNPEIDGAIFGYIRFASILGTIHDIGLGPENGTQDSVLIGSTTFSKFEKSGYWTMGSLQIRDIVGNQRYENHSTVGMKLYIENPLEDVIPPKWNYDLKMEVVEGKFTSSYSTAYPDENGRELQAIKTTYSFYDDIPFGGSESNFILSTPDKLGYESYYWRLGGVAIIDSSRNFGNGLKSVKHIEAYLKIEEYMPSGYYAITGMGASDIANNTCGVYFVKDTSDFIIPPGANNIFKDVRDSIYVKTKFPDYVKPELDVNNIFINAQPTNPIAPDGETRVNMSFIARDLSDFFGKESGVYFVEFVFRDPLGIFHNSAIFVGNLFDTSPDNTFEWKHWTHNFLLPKGSPPGKWGLSSASVTDKAGNRRNYSFVEYVRFDVIESGIVLEEPLDAEINAKYINAANVDNIDIRISCKPSSGLKYVYTIYSLMGGNVVRGEGVMLQDTMIIQGVNTLGVLDGIIKLTVQLIDSESQIIATKTVEYDKDTERPKAYYTKANLQNEGDSNLDNVIFEIIFEASDIGADYELKIERYSSVLKNAKSSEIFLAGIIESQFPFELGVDLSQFINSVIKTSLTLTDKTMNTGDPVENYYLVLVDKLILLNSKPDYDCDGIPDLVTSYVQSIPMNKGWNIISFNNVNESSDLMSVFSTLKEDNTLKKIVDESGNSLEDYGFFGGWQNSIGDLDNTRGYKVNLTSDATLSVMGWLVASNNTINLNAGWNIIGYPAICPNNALNVLQPLINEGILIKVMDESGKSIEDFGSFGGWQNNIGNLNPGKGYKVLVSQNASIIIDDDVATKSATIIAEVIPSNWFKPAFTGNGTDHLNLHVVNLLQSGLMEGDEIGIFDGNLCVGSARLTLANMAQNRISIAASANDELESHSNGFTPGNDITLKLYRNGSEIPLTWQPVNNSIIKFDKNQSVFAMLRIESTMGLKYMNDEMNVLCYPNPFSDYINIEIKSLNREMITVEVIDMLARKVCVLYHGMADGNLNIVWNGLDAHNNQLSPGVYLLKVNNTIKKLIMNTSRLKNY